MATSASATAAWRCGPASAAPRRDGEHPASTAARAAEAALAAADAAMPRGASRSHASLPARAPGRPATRSIRPTQAAAVPTRVRGPSSAKRGFTAGPTVKRLLRASGVVQSCDAMPAADARLGAIAGFVRDVGARSAPPDRRQRRRSAPPPTNGSRPLGREHRYRRERRLAASATRSPPACRRGGGAAACRSSWTSSWAGRDASPGSTTRAPRTLVGPDVFTGIRSIAQLRRQCPHGRAALRRGRSLDTAAGVALETTSPLVDAVILAAPHLRDDAVRVPTSSRGGSSWDPAAFHRLDHRGARPPRAAARAGFRTTSPTPVRGRRGRCAPCGQARRHPRPAGRGVVVGAAGADDPTPGCD
jgi:hypothetical protein